MQFCFNKNDNGSVNMKLQKDAALNQLALEGNVAQFISFSPTGSNGPVQTYCRVWGHQPNHNFKNTKEGLATLLEKSPEKSINLRSYTPNSPKSREFIYGITDVNTAYDHLQRLNNDGLFVIANETVDVSDSGVSGVIEAGIIEFSPDDTPRCVEKDGVVSLTTEEGIRLIEQIYGFPPDLPPLSGARVEFSIHPRKRGFHHSHTLLWEREDVETPPQKPNLNWPNNFSRMIGDKGFGLLMAEMAGAPVPETNLISRRVRPFLFGQKTDNSEIWFRTCPVEQRPGEFTTTDRWIDPFVLLAQEDPQQESIASVLAQSSVTPEYSGAAITDSEGSIQIEGTSGKGDLFMLGQAKASDIPEKVLSDLRSLYQLLERRFGPVRFEWVHDGTKAWVVQLHKGATSGAGLIIVPGDADEWVTFYSEKGIAELRVVLEQTPPEYGIEIEGYFGLTSHLADLIRKTNRPAKIVKRNIFKMPTQLTFPTKII